MTPPTTRNRGESEIEHISSKLLLTEKNLVSIFKSTVVKGNSFHPITFFIHTKQKMFERTLDKVEFAIPAAEAGPVRCGLVKLAGWVHNITTVVWLVFVKPGPQFGLD